MTLDNVLVIRPGALGDAVLTLPALTTLADAGAASVTVLGTPASWAFLSDTCPVKIVDFASGGWLGLFADGAALSKAAIEILERTQTAIVYLSDETHALQRRLSMSGVRTILVLEPPTAAPRERHSEHGRRRFKWDEIQDEHASRCLLDPLNHCGVDAAILNHALDPARLEGLQWIDANPEARSTSNYVVIHPGSGGRKKCWPARCFAAVAARLWAERALDIRVLFGPADDEFRRAFELEMPEGVPWQRVENKSLREVFALLNSALFYLGNDSGVSHLAARATAVVSIFGPTDPQRWAPVGRDVTIVEAPGGDLSALAVDTVFDALPFP